MFQAAVNASPENVSLPIASTRGPPSAGGPRPEKSAHICGLVAIGGGGSGFKRWELAVLAALAYIVISACVGRKNTYGKNN